MDHIAPRDRDFDVDLESGGTFNEEESSKDPVSGAKKQAKLLFAKVCGGFMDGPTKGENGMSLCCTNSDGVSSENVKVVTDMMVEGVEKVNSAEKKPVKEKRKKTSNKKPPRPPRGPSLDAVDKKLIREISELAMLKRARIERMKALKKIKAAKAPSSSSNLFAMVFTILFCLVIIFQGMSSRTSQHTDFEGSSESGGVQGGLVSVQYYGNPSPNDSNGPASGSPNLVERVAGSDPQVRLRRFNR